MANDPDTSDYGLLILPSVGEVQSVLLPLEVPIDDLHVSSLDRLSQSYLQFLSILLPHPQRLPEDPGLVSALGMLWIQTVPTQLQGIDVSTIGIWELHTTSTSAD